MEILQQKIHQVQVNGNKNIDCHWFSPQSKFLYWYFPAGVQQIQPTVHL